jgi:hypothetical protein
MPTFELPNDFTWTWEGATVRVELPPMVETAQHVYETVLSRADAQRLADAVWDRATEGGRSGPLRAPNTIRLVHDARYAPATLSSFREKLVAALEGKRLRPDVELVVAGLPSEGDLELPSLEMEPETTAASSDRSPQASPTFPPEPVLPPAFDPASDTDLGLDSEFETSAPSADAAPAPREAPVETARPERGSPQGLAPVRRQRFDKKKKK